MSKFVKAINAKQNIEMGTHGNQAQAEPTWVYFDGNYDDKNTVISKVSNIPYHEEFREREIFG